ncbi:MAG: DUF1232 domain-containing protein [Phyllobacteriaceae bacterium]|nr:DUF1232 domain-containing protein [Phyllobacteriaceae bacterium]
MTATIDNMTQGKADGVRRNFWKTVKRAARQVPFMEDVVAAYYCAFDRETPAQARAILIGALAYFVLPFDAIPDFIAMVGFADDVAVLTAAMATLRQNVKPSHREAAKRALEEIG